MVTRLSKFVSQLQQWVQPRLNSDSIKSQPSFSYSIDQPQAETVVNSPDIVISGWIATKLGQRIENLKLSDQQGLLQPLQIVERHDVIAAFPNKSTVGFYQTVPRSVLSQDQDSRFQIEFTIDGQSCHFPINLATALPGITAFLARKHRKLKRIQATLRCPMCAHDQLQTRIDQSGVEVMDCNHCQTQFEFNGDRNYNFLSPELREYGKVKSTDVISDHHYDLISCAIIDEFQDGLILDVGCGLRNYYYHNVVNFEIVDYPTTDVLGIGERLPFKSNSFDVVFSFNVLEHVRQPFECAAEILRVLKPGGKLYVVAPF